MTDAERGLSLARIEATQAHILRSIQDVSDRVEREHQEVASRMERERAEVREDLRSLFARMEQVERNPTISEGDLGEVLAFLKSYNRFRSWFWRAMVGITITIFMALKVDKAAASRISAFIHRWFG